MCKIIGRIDLAAMERKKEELRKYAEWRSASVAIWRQLDILGKRKRKQPNEDL